MSLKLFYSRALKATHCQDVAAYAARLLVFFLAMTAAQTQALSLPSWEDVKAAVGQFQKPASQPEKTDVKRSTMKVDGKTASTSVRAQKKNATTIPDQPKKVVDDELSERGDLEIIHDEDPPVGVDLGTGRRAIWSTLVDESGVSVSFDDSAVVVQDGAVFVSMVSNFETALQHRNGGIYRSIAARVRMPCAIDALGVILGQTVFTHAGASGDVIDEEMGPIALTQTPAGPLIQDRVKQFIKPFCR